MRATREQHKRAGQWAGVQADSAWSPLPLPDDLDGDYLFAVRDSNGRILSGSRLAFSDAAIAKLEAMDKYGYMTEWIRIPGRVL